MRKSKYLPFDMREQVIKSMPWVSALMVTLAAATAAVGELADAAHFF